MLRMRKGPPVYQEVALTETASIRVRPATQFDCEEASSRTSRDLAGLIEGSETAERVAALLGEEFDVAGLNDDARNAAAAQKLARVYLVMACNDGWQGVGLDDGTLLEKPEPWSVAMLLSDPMICAGVMSVINARVHREDAEGNGLPASPNGGAGILDSAPSAAPLANLAPQGQA
jgi:hypothetical protein